MTQTYAEAVFDSPFDVYKAYSGEVRAVDELYTLFRVKRLDSDIITDAFFKHGPESVDKLIKAFDGIHGPKSMDRVAKLLGFAPGIVLQAADFQKAMKLIQTGKE
jgi:hypothetical protein